MKSIDEMIGFELPGYDEYCSDRGLDPSNEDARENYNDYLEDNDPYHDERI